MADRKEYFRTYRAAKRKMFQKTESESDYSDINIVEKTIVVHKTSNSESESLNIYSESDSTCQSDDHEEILSDNYDESDDYEIPDLIEQVEQEDQVKPEILWNQFVFL